MPDSLPFHLGCFAHTPERVLRHQAKIGHAITCLQVSPTRGSWSSILNTWWLKKPAGFPTSGIFDVSVPLWQADGNLNTAAAGGYNTQWQKLGQTLHAAAPGSLVRPGWEFNLTGWPWHANKGNVAQWRAAFRHAYSSLKAGGPSLLIEWNPNAGGPGPLTAVEDAWPGDDYVDVVALDSYDWWPPYTSDTNWARHRDEYGGWKHWIDFARAHGKKFTVPEFGLAPGSTNGGGDNARFFEYVMPYLAANRDIIHAISYFDEPASYIRNSIGDGQVPLGAAEYKRQLDTITTTTTPEPARITTAEEGPAGEVLIQWTPAGQAASVTRDGVNLDGAGPETITTSVSEHRFTRLQPATTYTFTVTIAGQTAAAQVTTAAAPAEETVDIIVTVPTSWVTSEARIYPR